MPIPFTCPHCGHATTVDDQFAGQTGPCSECGQMVTVPGAATPAAPSPLSSSPPPMNSSYGLDMRPKKRSNTTVIIVVILVVGVLFCGGLILMLGIAGMFAARGSSEMVECFNNEKNLALAVLVYESEHGEFPPAAGPIVEQEAEETEEGETPQQNDWSWRVRILPHIERSDLYDQFNFDEPWDSEHNLTVAENVVSIFQCPSDEPGFKEINGHQIPLTNYVMVTGPSTVGSIDGESVSLELIAKKDGAHCTAMIVEVKGANRPAWTEPIDITIDELARGANASGMCVGSNHFMMISVATCDGMCQPVPEMIEGDEFRKLGCYDDGPPEFMDY